MKNSEFEKAFKHFSNNDLIICRLIKKYSKCNLKSRRNYFPALLKIIINQQLSIHSANAIIERFLKNFNYNPLPEQILQVKESKLRSFGLSNAKVKYVKDLSEKLISNEICLTGLQKKTDDEIIDYLTAVRGIGEWTVHIFLIFTLGRLNVLPHGDLGIKKAIMLNYNFNLLPSAEKVKEIALMNNWSPYNSVASWYLWKSLS